MKQISSFLLQLILLYIDPGSGSYLVQVIIAGALAVLFYFKNIWWKIKAFFTGTKKKDPINNDQGNA